MDTPNPTPNPTLNPTPTADPETALFVENFQQAALALGAIPADLMHTFAQSHWMGRAIDWNRQGQDTKPGPDFAAILVCLPADRIREGLVTFLESAPENVQPQLVEGFVEWCLSILIHKGLAPNPDELARRMRAALDALDAPPSAREAVDGMLAALGAGLAPAPTQPAEPPVLGTVTVLEGEHSLAQVAHRLYGDVARWLHLAKANPDHPTGAPLAPGQVLKLPD